MMAEASRKRGEFPALNLKIHQNQNQMNTYQITYNGNSSRFQGRTHEIRANSPKEAVHKFYQTFLEYNYFLQDDGSVKDCNGITIADNDDDCIKFDGGYFYAELI